jgi:predicted TIM-barrel fold metal-dependent hydrolase
MQYRAISGDSHVLEPPNVFQDRLPTAMKELGPKIVECEDGGQGWTWEGRKAARSFGLDAMAGKSDFKEFKDHGLRFSDLRKGNWDAKAHLSDQDVDRVDCSVLYGGIGMGLAAGIKDRELRLACVRAYNDWLLDEFQAVNPQRLVGLGVLPIDDGMEEILKEMERIARKNCRGAFLLTYPDKLYTDKYYEPLWAAAADMQMPLHFHRATGKHMPRGTSDVGGKLMVAGIVLRFFAALEPVTHILFTGALHRYPGLKIVSAESDAGWVAYYELCVTTNGSASATGRNWNCPIRPASTSAGRFTSPSWMTRWPAPTSNSPAPTT